MIEAIMRIGEWSGNRERTLGSLINFVEDPNSTGRYRKVIIIVLERKGGDYRFKEVDLEEFREDHILKYLYRKGSSRGTDLTPTSKLSGKDIGSTFENKLIKCLLEIKSNSTKFRLSKIEQEEVNIIINQLNTNKQSILDGLNERVSEIARGEGAILTLEFESGGERRYLGDFELFQKVLLHKAKVSYYSQYKKEAISKDRVCSVCKKERDEVYGFVNTYNFYTVDKPGFVTSGFRQEDAWKNYPVCLDCAIRLEEGKKYISNNLSFKFYGFNYLMIPKFFNENVMDEVLTIIEGDFEKEMDKSIKASFEQKYIRRLTDAEDEIFELISEQKDFLNLNLMFYQEKQSGSVFNILMYIEDILPSRIRRLFDVKREVDEIDIFKKPEKDGQRLLYFNFKLLRDFFPYVSKTVSYDKNFLEMVNKVFSLKPVDYGFLLRFIVQKLRDRFVRGETVYLDTLRGFMLLYYIGRLGILKNGGGRMEIEIIKELQDVGGVEATTLLKRIELFFEQHKGFFDSPMKKAVFLVGVLVQKLLNIQRLPDVSNAQPGKEPFRHQLKGLKLDEKQVKKLLPEAQNKLEEYGKNYYRQLESVISQYLVATGTNWQITNDEISFYFVLGMNLSNLFKTREEDKNDDQSAQ
jgi:CRISPR-associated protein Csh1